jgi:hypothetical protein
MTGTDDRAAPGGGGETFDSSNPFYFLPYERELFPIEGSIGWKPRGDEASNGRAQHQPDIVIEQRVFVTLRHEMVRDLEGRTAGLLLGHVLECPSTQRLWVDVVASIGAGLAFEKGLDSAVEPGAHGDSADALEDALLSLFEEPCWTGGVPVGWYRTRPGSECTLTEAEIEVHKRLFSEPWQFSLLMVSDLTAPKGAVFWCNEGERLQPDRHRPFFERLDGSTDPSARPPFTCVGFSNYETTAPVVPASPPPSNRHTGSQLVTPLVMAPSGRSTDSVRRGRRSALALAASVLIVGGAGLLLRERPAALSSAPDTTLFSAPFAVHELPQVFGEATFRSEYDAFRTEVYAYYDLAEAYQTNGVGCDRMSEAYRTADDAFIALSGKVAAVRDEGESAIPSSYRSAAEVMRGIDQHFDASGCPRLR